MKVMKKNFISSFKYFFFFFFFFILFFFNSGGIFELRLDGPVYVEVLSLKHYTLDMMYQSLLDVVCYGVPVP